MQIRLRLSERSLDQPTLSFVLLFASRFMLVTFHVGCEPHSGTLARIRTVSRLKSVQFSAHSWRVLSLSFVLPLQSYCSYTCTTTVHGFRLRVF